MRTPGSTFAESFPVHDATGASSDADSLPTAALRRNGSNTAEAVTVAKSSTGDYTASGTIPSGWAGGDVVELIISATVDSITAKLVISLGTLEVETAGSGAGITIVPVTTKHRVGEPSPVAVAAFVGADFSQAFTFKGDLTGETFTFAVETSPGREDIAADYDPDVTYDAETNQTVITVTIDREHHTDDAVYRYALRHVSGNNQPIAWGDYAVSYAPDSLES